MNPFSPKPIVDADKDKSLKKTKRNMKKEKGCDDNDDDEEEEEEEGDEIEEEENNEEESQDENPYSSLIPRNTNLNYRERYLTRPEDYMVICMAMISVHVDLDQGLFCLMIISSLPMIISSLPMIITSLPMIISSNDNFIV